MTARRNAPAVWRCPARRLGAALVLLAATALAGCDSGGAGHLALRVYDARDFTEVALNTAARVLIVSGDYAVAVSAEDDVLPSVRVQVRDGTLVLARDIDWVDGVRATRPIEFRVSAPSLTSVRVASSGEADVGDLAGDRLALAVSGSGEIRAAKLDARAVTAAVTGAGVVVVSEVRATLLRCSISGSGVVSVGGETERLELDITGAGSLRGSALRTQQAFANITGSGNALVWPESKLEARVSGAGRIRYRGDPQLDTAVQGAGSVASVVAAVQPAGD